MAALTVANLASAMAPTFGSLVLARFASGFPHGAYFGIGAVVATSLVPRHRRARAVAMTMMGLTVANVVGVPLTTLLGQSARLAQHLRDGRRDRRPDPGGDRSSSCRR